MRIIQMIEKVPGGLMTVPLFAGALVKSFVPGSALYFGSFTQGIMTGAIPLLAAWLFCMGASIDRRRQVRFCENPAHLSGLKYLWLGVLHSFVRICCQLKGSQQDFSQDYQHWLSSRHWI